MAAMKRIYLDNAATTPMDPEVLKAMLPFLSDAFGNPSSIHSFGQETRAAVEESRDKIASLISARSEEIVFTGGGFLERRGFRITYLPVGIDGLVDPQDVKKAITDRTILISVMHANNEVGTIEPLAEIGKIAREEGIYFHTDAVQTVGHIPVNVDELGIDLLAMSAHKLNGPKGVGALYIRKGIKGNGRRSGTPDSPSW